jgi:hypothetical protein
LVFLVFQPAARAQTINATTDPVFVLVTNQFAASGNFNFTNPMNPIWPQTFYQLQIP